MKYIFHLALILILSLSEGETCGINPQTNCGSVNVIPKVIWTFWSSDELPEIIKKCIKTWRDLNPTYKVNIISKSKLEKYIGKDKADEILNWKFKDSAQRLAHLVKLEVLEQYGGIWLDASIVLYEPIDWVHTHTKQVVIYSILERSTEPLLDSWFIASSKGNSFISEWNKEHKRVGMFKSIKDYIIKVDHNMIIGIDNPEYFLMYVVARRVYRMYKEMVKVLSTSDGPMHYLTIKGGVKGLCEEKRSLAKLRREERKEILNDPQLASCVFDGVKKEKTSASTEIPKIIWTFWNSIELPGLIERCIATWKKFNPNYVINLVTPLNLKNFVGDEAAYVILNWKYNISPQFLSHMVRLELLSQHGGIWLDASTVLFESFDWVGNYNKQTVVYSILERSTEPLIDNWFIAASKENSFITDWNNEHKLIGLHPTLKDFVDKVEPSLTEGITNPEGFVMYIISRKILRKYTEMVTILSTSDGPLSYMIKEGGLKALCLERRRFVKLRREERIQIFEDPTIETCLFGQNLPISVQHEAPFIPKEIWTFWDSDTIPPIIERCIQTWRDLHPDYSINIVTKSNLSNFIGEDRAEKLLTWKFIESPQRLSNLIRLELLELYGGIWLDASMVLYQSIDWVREWDRTNLLIENGMCTLYSIKERSWEPLLDNWFIACPKGHPFIKNWNAEHKRVAQYGSIRDFITAVEPTLLRGIDNPENFLMYVISRWSSRKHKHEIRILSTSDGPMNYQLNGGLGYLCKNKPEMVKLRRNERKEIEKKTDLLECLFGKK